MKKIIGISGKAQHGKDTVANILKEMYGGEVVHLADLLKEQAKMIGWDGKKDEGGRTLLQKFSAPIKEYGNWLASKYPEYAEYGNGNYYSASLFDKIMASEEDIFYIADMRFTSEYYFFRRQNEGNDIHFKTLRVNRPNFDNGLSEEQKNDESECALDHAIMDFTINNDSDLVELREKLYRANILDSSL